MGNVLGWSSPALPNLARSEDFLDITSSDQSWIGSLVTVIVNTIKLRTVDDTIEGLD